MSMKKIIPEARMGAKKQNLTLVDRMVWVIYGPCMSRTIVVPYFKHSVNKIDLWPRGESIAAMAKIGNRETVSSHLEMEL